MPKIKLIKTSKKDFDTVAVKIEKRGNTARYVNKDDGRKIKQKEKENELKDLKKRQKGDGKEPTKTKKKVSQKSFFDGLGIPNLKITKTAYQVVLPMF